MKTALQSLAVLTLLASWTTLHAADTWPEYRGPNGQGHAEAKNLPVEWSETKNIAWKTPLPGRGWSSPVVSDGKVWMTAATDEPVSPEAKKQRLIGSTSSMPLLVSDNLSMRAICVDLKSGKLLHDIELMTEKKPQPIHTLNSYASPSPILEEGKLYCHFGAYGTACLDTDTKKVLWSNQTLRLNHENGPGGSPVLWGDLIIFHCDGSDLQYVAAVNKHTGKTVWRTTRSGKMNSNPQLTKAYGTPLIAKIAGEPVVVSTGADWLYGYDPATGKELWKVAYGELGFSIVPRPVVGNGMAYMCTSFMQSRLLAFDLTSKTPKIAWRYQKQVPNMSSPLLVGDKLYFVSNKGMATCLDAKTGEGNWVERLGGQYCSSPLYAEGRIYFMNRDGETKVVATGGQYKQLASNQLDGEILASPAAIDGSLFIRTDKALYRITK